MPKLIIHTGGIKPIELTFRDANDLNKVERDIVEAIRNRKSQTFVRFHFIDLLGKPRRAVLPVKLLCSSVLEFTNNWREPDDNKES